MTKKLDEREEALRELAKAASDADFAAAFLVLPAVLLAFLVMVALAIAILVHL